MNEHKNRILPYYHGLFYLRLLGGVLLLLAFFATLIPFAAGAWYNVAQSIVRVGVAVCLFLLSGRWRLAGMARILSLLCDVISLAFFRLLYAYGVQLDMAEYGLAMNVLSRTASVLGMIALFLEYTAHAALVPEDRKKWYIFLICSVTVSTLSFASVSLLQPMLGGLSVETMRVWSIVSHMVSLAVESIYLVLLYRGIRALNHQEGSLEENEGGNTHDLQ